MVQTPSGNTTWKRWTETNVGSNGRSLSKSLAGLHFDFLHRQGETREEAWQSDTPKQLLA